MCVCVRERERERDRLREGFTREIFQQRSERSKGVKGISGGSTFQEERIAGIKALRHEWVGVLKDQPRGLVLEGHQLEAHW